MDIQDFQKWEARDRPTGPFWKPAESPTVLFHYTDVSALIAILQHEILWASDYRTLNDLCEGDLIRSDLSINDNVVKDDDKTENLIFLTSLSEKRDSLSQWRAYGTYALEINVAKLTSYFPQLNSTLFST